MEQSNVKIDDEKEADEVNKSSTQQPAAAVAVATNATEPKETRKASVEKTVELDKLDKIKETDISETQSESFDELSSLEQEIAKLHSVSSESGVGRETATEIRGAAYSSNGGGGGDSGAVNSRLHKVADEEARNCNVTPEQALEETAAMLETGGGLVVNDVIKLNAAETTLEDIDLIAVLQGTDIVHIEQHVEKGSPNKNNELNVGVTIEGEGQYEIMEIDDDDVVEVQEKKNSEPKTNIRILNKAIGKTKMSPEQERKVAMEQMANLSSKHGRRKQELKPVDILNSINDDWSEYGSDIEPATASGVSQKIVVKTVDTQKAKISKKPKESSVVAPEKVLSSSTPHVNSSNSKETSNTKSPEINTKQSTSQDHTAESTGFKRIIKRKIIWDPDVPETQKSYSQYAATKPNAPKNSSPSPKPKSALLPNSALPIKKESTLTKTSRPSTPNETSAIQTIIIEDSNSPLPTAATSKRETTPKPATPKRVSTPKPATAKRVSPPKPATPKRVSTPKPAPIPKRAPTPKLAVTPKVAATSQSAATPKPAVGEAPKPAATQKRATTPRGRSQTPSLASNGTPAKRKKISEIDRLLGDEGAANMIHAIEQERLADGSSETNESEQTHKPLMRKRAMTICEPAPPFEQIAPPTAKKTTPPKTKRPPVVKSEASNWDYVYKQRAIDDCMIIRRRSNSSYSSGASVHRLSIDKSNISDSEQSNNSIKKQNDGPSGTSATDNTFKFAKPVNKTTTIPKTSRSKSVCTIKNDMNRGERSTSVSRDKPTHETTGDITVRYIDKVAQITLHTQRSKIIHCYGINLLNNLCETLKKLEKNNDVNTVLLTGSGAHFCQGIDFHELTFGSFEKRKNCATQLATAIKTYLKNLATFPKPVVACVNGNLRNLGVMQLPLFDYVVGSEKCTFETPYAKIGQVPEGLSFWHKTTNISNTTKRRLFLLNEKLTLHELGGTSAGLINKTAPPSKVLEESLAMAQKISETAGENYFTCVKKYAIKNLEEKIKQLDEEFETIVEQWTSTKLLDKFKNYVEFGKF